jgi:formyltetrahydrofolate deformylase
MADPVPGAADPAARAATAADSGIVLVDCPDEVGLIHRITGVLFARRLNIENNQEFVDTAARHFFFRAEVAAGVAGPAAAAGLVEDLNAVLPAGARVRVTRGGVRPIVIMGSLEPHCLGELLLLAASGDLPCTIRAVVGNHDRLRGLTERFGVPFHHVPAPAAGADDAARLAHEATLERAIMPHAPDYLVLARYMRVLSAGFVDRWAGRIVNIHHSFLPAFAGAAPYRQAFVRGVKLIGATAHFVTRDLDEGPIIAQDVIPVDHGFTPERMARAGRDVEKLVLARAVRLLLEERVFVHGRRTIVFA